MRTAEIMTRPVVSTSPETPLREAIVQLIEEGFAGLPVVDDDGQVVGIMTEADALRGGAAGGGDVASRVADVMTSPVEVVSPDADVTDVARVMLRDGLRSVPVVDNGVLIGVVSRRDVLRPFVRPDDAIATHVRTVLDSYEGRRGRWDVDVTQGAVTVTGEVFDDAERQVIASLVRIVPGVLSADVRRR